MTFYSIGSTWIGMKFLVVILSALAVQAAAATTVPEFVKYFLEIDEHLQATDKNSEDYQRLKGMQYIPTFVGLNVFTALSPINFGGCSLTVTQLGDGVSLTGRLSNGKELTVKMRNYPTFRADVEHGPDGRGSRTIHLFGTVTNKILDSRDKYESLIRVWINEDLSIKGMAFSLDRNERGAALDSRSCK